jgi:hypothetical protein
MYDGAAFFNESLRGFGVVLSMQHYGVDADGEQQAEQYGLKDYGFEVSHEKEISSIPAVRSRSSSSSALPRSADWSPSMKTCGGAASVREIYLESVVGDHRDHGIDEKDEQKKHHIDEWKHFHSRLLGFISAV